MTESWKIIATAGAIAANRIASSSSAIWNISSIASTTRTGRTCTTLVWRLSRANSE